MSSRKPPDNPSDSGAGKPSAKVIAFRRNIEQQKKKVWTAESNGEKAAAQVFKADIKRLQQELSAQISSEGLVPANDGHCAKLVADRYREKIRHVRGGDFYIYDGKRWELDKDNERIRDLVLKFVRDNHAAADGDDGAQRQIAKFGDLGHPSAIVKNLRSNRDISISASALDRDDFLLNVSNGTVDLRTRTLRPHDPKDLITRMAPVVYEPKADCPKWREFLGKACSKNDAQRPELESYLQRLAGSCLTGDTSEQKFFFFLGGGGNGKSTWLKVMAALLGNGEYANDAPRSTFLTARSSRQEVAIGDVAEFRLVYTNERDDGNNKANAELLKTLTGESIAKAWHLYKGYVGHVPRCKIICGMNSLPIIDLTEAATDRRFVPIPFDWTVPKEERKLDLDKVIVRVEASGILNWAIEGCLAWQRTGLDPDAVPAIKQARDVYRQEQDKVGLVMLKICRFGSGLMEPAGNIIPSYKAACAAQQREPESEKKVREWLRGKGCTDDRLPDAARTSIWRGVKINEEDRVVPWVEEPDSQAS